MLSKLAFLCASASLSFAASCTPFVAVSVIFICDIYSREQEYRKKKNSTVKFNINDDVNHPKFGKGTIEHIEQLEGSVRLHVRFGEDLKKIDQKWLLQAGLKKAGASRHI